jgi:NADPH:quinone reductase-like Zn-dependent oxidoreductase
MKLKRIIAWSAGAIALALLVTGLVAYWTSGNTCDDRTTAVPSTPMKAVVYCDYGSPDVLKLEAVEKPVPGDSQLLIRVRAASVNPLDWHYMRGTPYIGRLGMGLRKPAITRLGVDFAGIVESVGRNVTQFKPGDEVFGGRTGALAEYVTVRENGAVVLKPANLTFEEAAAVGVAAITALQGLRDEGKLQPGQKVLINGASGGVGTFAVQIAKALGAEVTGVCSTRNVELVRSLGAAHVIDYTRTDFTQAGRRYDVILDNVEAQPLQAVRSALAPTGTLIPNSGRGGRRIGPLGRIVKARARSLVTRQTLKPFLSVENHQDLLTLTDWLEAGELTPVIDRTYRLSAAADALRYVGAGHTRGKVVITV